MRILICSMNYTPEMTGIGRYSGEMAEWFADKGHTVIVVCSPPYYPGWKVMDGYSTWRYNKELLNGVKVIRCPLWVPAKPSGIKRIFHLLSFSISSFFVTILESFKKPDIIITIEPPLFSAPSVLIGSKISKAKSIMHVQDFEVDAAIALGQLKSEISKKIARKLEKYLLRRFAIVSTISKSMINRLKSKGIDQAKIAYIPNWVDTNKIKTLATKSKYRNLLNIDDDKFVVLYSGNIGRKQGLDIILKVAEIMLSNKKVIFVVSGDGAGKNDFLSKANKLENVITLPLQPEDKLSELLNLADVHFLPMLEGTDELVMPSKLGNMMSSGRPVIATAKQDSEIANFIGDAGFVVPHGDINQIIASIEYSIKNPERLEILGKKGREIVINNLEKEIVLTKAEQLLANSMK